MIIDGPTFSRIPINTAQHLAKELKKRGKLYDFMVKDNEEHGFHQEQNKIELWKKETNSSRQRCSEGH